MSHVSASGNSDRTGDKLDETELLRMFIDTLRKVIENYTQLGREKSTMQRASTEYFMFDIKEIHTILEEALRPVFRIDRQEHKKKTRIRAQHKKSGKREDLDRMDRADDSDEDSVQGFSSDEEQDDIIAMSATKIMTETVTGLTGLSDRERKDKLKMQMINSRLDELIEVMDQCAADMKQDSKALSKVKNSLKTVQHLSKITEKEQQDFCLYIEEIRYIANQKGQGQSYEATKKILGYICLNPSYIFKQLTAKKPRSVILTSGTLAPMASFADELRTDFGV